MADLNWSELWDEDEQRYRIQTRDGRKVRIFTTDARDPDYPIVGEVDDGRPGRWTPLRWSRDGELLPNMTGDDTHSDDLVPEPLTVRRWLNVYKTSRGNYSVPRLHMTKAGAFKWLDENTVDELMHVATVPVEWTE